MIENENENENEYKYKCGTNGCGLEFTKKVNHINKTLICPVCYGPVKRRK